MELLEIPIFFIRANEYQPRTLFDAAELQALAESIREHGVLSPLMVTANGAPGPQLWDLISGERRLRAAEIAGLRTVPCQVRPAAEARDRLELALIENLIRQDLSPVEEARGYQRLVDEFGLTDAQIGERFGRDRSTVANKRRLLALPEAILSQLEQGELAEGRARELIPIAQRNADVAIAAAAAIAAPSVEPNGEGPHEPPPRPEQLIWEAWLKIGRKLEAYNMSFPFEWTPPVEEAPGADGQFVPIRACEGCPDIRTHAEHDWLRCCIRPECMAVKISLYGRLEAARVSEATGIPLAGPGEKLGRVPLRWDTRAKVEGWILKKAPHLRLKAEKSSDFNARSMLGSGVVSLWTTKPHLLEKLGQRSEAGANRDEQRRRWEREQKEQLLDRVAAQACGVLAAIPAGIALALAGAMAPRLVDLPEVLEERIAARDQEAAHTIIFQWYFKADASMWNPELVQILRDRAVALGLELADGWDRMEPFPGDQEEESGNE